MEQEAGIQWKRDRWGGYNITMTLQASTALGQGGKSNCVQCQVQNLLSWKYFFKASLQPFLQWRPCVSNESLEARVPPLAPPPPPPPKRYYRHFAKDSKVQLSPRAKSGMFGLPFGQLSLLLPFSSPWLTQTVHFRKRNYFCHHSFLPLLSSTRTWYLGRLITAKTHTCIRSQGEEGEGENLLLCTLISRVPGMISSFTAWLFCNRFYARDDKLSCRGKTTNHPAALNRLALFILFYLLFF